MTTIRHARVTGGAPVAFAFVGALSALTGACGGEESSPNEAVARVALNGGKSFWAGGLTPGDLATENGIGAVVPVAGEAVTLTITYETGERELLEIVNHGPGQVRVRHAARAGALPAADRGAELATSSPSECSDGAYGLIGWRWDHAWAWAFNPTPVPSGTTASSVESSLKSGVADMTTSRNKCGLADEVSATSNYLGRTTLGTQVMSDGTTTWCGTRDTSNVMAFGTLRTGVLATTCSWYYASTGLAVESDIKFNAAYAWFAGRSVPSGCTNRYSIEGVGAHEVGHVYGLDDLSSAEHGNLTMAGSTGPCTSKATTLGLGDVNGLRVLY